jgi:hypothetical protein
MKTKVKRKISLAFRVEGVVSVGITYDIIASSLVGDSNLIGTVVETYLMDK